MADIPLQIHVEPATTHHGPPDAYQNKSNPRGAVLIANYDHFEGTQLADRTDSEVNVSNLKELFSQMGYEVAGSITNETKNATLNSLNTFRSWDKHRSVDSMVIIFMSYGRDEEFYTSDGELIHFKQIYQMFSNENCPALANKPKLFIFQFYGKNLMLYGGGPPVTNGYTTLKGRSKDITCTFVCLSTAEGDQAYRYFEHRALFFHHVCNVFMNHAKDLEFSSLMRMVQKELPDKESSEVRQIGIRTGFYFNPPLAGEPKSRVASTAENSQATMADCPIPLKNQVCADGLETNDAYTLSVSRTRGKVLIVNNLRGCQKDVEKLSDIFSQLGFVVAAPVFDVGYDDLMAEIEKFKQNHSYDSAIVIFYGHGFDEHLVFRDRAAMKHKDFLKKFSNVNCPDLSGKPKLFIFNSCFTEQLSHQPAQEVASNGCLSEPVMGETSHGGDDSACVHIEQEDEEATVPEDAIKDMIIFSVEIDGGNCKDGSVLTDVLYQVLLDSRNAKMELFPLLRLMTKKLDDMSEGNTEEYFVEVSNFKFHKDFYLSLPLECETDGPIDRETSSIRKHIRRSSTGKIMINMNEANRMITGDNIYQNASFPHGISIIIGFTEYKTKKFPHCDMHCEEIVTLEDVAAKLCYSTNVKRNLMYKDILSHLVDIRASEDLQKVDSLMVNVVGFGRNVNHFYDVEGKEVSVVDVLHSFTDKKCPNLKGKPKIFFFHLTKGETWEDVPLVPTDDDLRDSISVYLISSLQENGSLHPEKGFNALCKALESKASTSDLETIIMEAEEKLKNNDHEGFEKIIVRPIKVEKEFYFNPKYFRT